MRVLYDGEKFTTQLFGGINAYFTRLIEGLPPRVAPMLACRETGSLFRPRNPRLRRYCTRPFRPAWLSRAWERGVFGWAARAGGCDLVHPTYYQTLTRRRVADFKKPTALTIYDMIHEKFGDALDPGGRHRRIKREAVQAADALICISRNTRRDLLEIYPWAAEKLVRVIHLAPFITGDMAAEGGGLPRRPYFLYVGSRERAYKNFDGLLRALAALRQRRPGALLCVAGWPKWYPHERRLLEDLGLAEAVLNLGGVSHGRLAALYRGSLALVYPSRYEGFGIPPLEAMSCGAAVLACRAASIPEVTGRAALLVSPGVEEELVEGLDRLYCDSALRERLIEAGRRQAAKFSWREAAARTVEVYDQLTS